MRFFTDPACSWSWGVEPAVRKLMLEYGGELDWRWVMGGLARDLPEGYAPGRSGSPPGGDGRLALVADWLDVAAQTGMPIDPRLWVDAALTSSYPACMAVKAAAEQGSERGLAYLRTLREGLMCFRRKLDTTEALVEEGRRAGLDGERFRRDLASHATVEAFGADLELARTVPEQARAAGHLARVSDGVERIAFPSASFDAEDGTRHWVFGHRPYEDFRAAAEAAGAPRAADAPPDVLGALRRFGRMAAAEVQAVCGLPGPPAAAQLWQLAAEWRVRRVPVLCGELWELA